MPKFRRSCLPKKKKTSGGKTGQKDRTPTSSPCPSPSPPPTDGSEQEEDEGTIPETQLPPAESEDEGPVDSPSKSTTTTSTQDKKRKRRQNLVLEEDMEEDIIEWLLQNPILYAKGMKEYKDTQKKQRMWEKKAKELNLESAKILQTWYKSMRTRLSKLTNQKPGDGTRDLTDRDRWVLEKFDFPRKHICRVTSRQATNVSIYGPKGTLTPFYSRLVIWENNLSESADIPLWSLWPRDGTQQSRIISLPIYCKDQQHHQLYKKWCRPIFVCWWLRCFLILKNPMTPLGNRELWKVHMIWT